MHRSFSISIASILVFALTWFATPAMSQTVMAQAESRHPATLLLNVTVEGKLGANGWFSGPALARAETNQPQAVITYSINGGPTTQGSEILLAQPGQYQIVWNACANKTCHDSFMQFIKVAFMDAQPLVYEPAKREWSFTGRVLDVREVSLMGFSGQVAQVQSRFFDPWVVLQVDQVSLAELPLQPGQWVRVAIAGTHVSKKSVDWTACTSEQPGYCYFGAVLDSGLESPDTDFPLTPSNELIRFGRSTPYWWPPAALYWNTTVIDEKSPQINIADDEQGPHLIGQMAEGEYNGNSEGWYRSPTVLARMNVAGGQARLYYQLDQQPKNRTFTGLVSVTGEGKHAIVWTLETGESVTQYISIDTHGPVVQWNEDSEFYLGGLVDLYGQAADPGPHSGIKEVEISFDGGKTWEVHPATMPGLCQKPDAFFWNFHWDTTKVKNGKYFLLARGRDYAGNLGATAVWSVVVNNP
jgi:hypothetical protein